MKKIIGRAIHALLEPVLPGKVYAMRAPDGDKGPFIIFQRVDRENWRAVNGPSGIAQATVQVDVYAPLYYDAQELAAQVETVLDGYRGDVYYGGNSPQDFIKVGGISLQGDADIFDQTDEPFLQRVTATYLVTYYQ